MDRHVLKKLQKNTSIQKKQSHLKELPNELNKLTTTKKVTTQNFNSLNNYFFRNKYIYINKYDRTTPYPLHSHPFVEMNYMLRGSCDQIIDGKTVHLNKGDLLMLDAGCNHSIKELKSDDLLITLLLHNQTVNINFLNKVRRNHSALSDYLLQQIPDDYLKFVLFKNDSTKEIQHTMESIITEYYANQEFSNPIIKSYISILIAQLIRHYRIPIDTLDSQQQLMINILKDISENYRNISLNDLAEKYDYNKNYLSNFIKKEVGRSFSNIIMDQRLVEAHNLIVSTNRPVSDIISDVGMKNKTSFYQKYKSYYSNMPSDERK